MNILPGNTVGIDLGTTYSSIAQLNAEGEPIALDNSDGKTITPSVVLLGEDGKVIVGPSPERMAIENPKNIIEAIKRQMGNKDFFVVYQGKRLTPEFISALILKKLKQDAEVALKAAGGGSSGNGNRRQRRDHGPVLFQRRPPQSNPGRRQDRGPECH